MVKEAPRIYDNLRGKVVLITGASEGLGKALAEAFARNHCNLYITARNYDKLAVLARELNERENYEGVIPLRLDVTHAQEVDRVAETVWNHRNGIDVWVNNAGMDLKLSLEELTPEKLQEITAVNYFGVVYGTQAVLRIMKKQHFPGDVVQIISTSAFTPRENESAYSAAKAAAAIFTESIQRELRAQKFSDIRVTPFYPGGMDTQFFAKAGLTLPERAMDPAVIADMVLYAVSLPRNVRMEPRVFRQG